MPKYFLYKDIIAVLILSKSLDSINKWLHNK